MTKHIFELENVSDKERQKFLLDNVLGQMVRGCMFAATVLFGPILFIYAVYLLGTLLPPESKDAQDPTPDSFISACENP